MPGSVIGTGLNLGYAGDPSRSIDSVIPNRVVKSNIVGGVEQNSPIAFGEPVVLNADSTYSRFGATGTADTFGGIAVREVKQATDYYSQTGSYLPGERADVMTRGTINVLCNVGTPTAGGKVYIRIAANASIPNGVVGLFEAAADGTNTLEIPELAWTTGKIDTNKIAEVTIKTIVNP